MTNLLRKPTFIYLDAGDVLFRRRLPDGDNISRELQIDPKEYHKIVMEVVMSQPESERNEFNHIPTLEDEYRIINRFHRRLCDYLGKEYDEAFITKLSEYRIKADFELKPGVVEGLKELSKSYRLGVLSNALPSRRHFELKLENIDQFFETVTLSWEEGIQKPEKGIYEIAIQRASVDPSEILFVDNKVNYLEGARNCGIDNLVLMKVKDVSDDYPMIDSLVELVQILNQLPA